MRGVLQTLRPWAGQGARGQADRLLTNRRTCQHSVRVHGTIGVLGSDLRESQAGHRVVEAAWTFSVSGATQPGPWPCAQARQLVLFIYLIPPGAQHSEQVNLCVKSF